MTVVWLFDQRQALEENRRVVVHRLISGLGWSLGLFMPLVGAMLYAELCVYFDEPWFVADRRADGPEMRYPNRAGSGAQAAR